MRLAVEFLAIQTCHPASNLLDRQATLRALSAAVARSAHRTCWKDCDDSVYDDVDCNDDEETESNQETTGDSCNVETVCQGDPPPGWVAAVGEDTSNGM